jgi:hypothetical protein
MEEPSAPMPEGKPMPAEAGPEKAPAMGEEQQASPEEQAQYEHFIAKGYEIIYDQKMLPKIIAMLEGGGDPVEGLARAASLVVGRLIDLATKAGDKLPGDVLLHAGTAVFEDLANLSRVAKIKDFSTDQDAFEAAYFKALDMLRQRLQESGGIDQAAAAADLDKLQQMDQAGELEAMFRNLAQKDEQESAPQDMGAEQAEAPRGLMQEAN